MTDATLSWVGLRSREGKSVAALGAVWSPVHSTAPSPQAAGQHHGARTRGPWDSTPGFWTESEVISKVLKNTAAGFNVKQVPRDGETQTVPETSLFSPR